MRNRGGVLHDNKSTISTFIFHKKKYYDVIIFADVSIFVDDVIIWEYIEKWRQVT